MGYGECLAGFEDVPFGGDPLFFDDVGCVACGEDGDGVFFEEIFEAADVVAVLVGEEDGG